MAALPWELFRLQDWPIRGPSGFLPPEQYDDTAKTQMAVAYAIPS